MASQGGDITTVKYVLSQNIADINRGGKHQRTPVLMAAYYGNIEVFDFLVSKGGDVSSVDDKGDTILHVACKGGHVEMVKHVLSKDIVDINCRGRYGMPPVLEAAYYGHKEVFDLLVGKGGDVSSVDDTGDNILHAACEGGHIEIVKYVLSKDIVDINSRGGQRMTCVMKAAYYGHRKVFDLLAGAGGDVPRKGVNSTIRVACRGRHLDMAKYVLSQHGVNISSKRCRKKL
ncbi:protein fem-1 homolog C-like [Haliotis rufescens]|uniref:protein fem-1 homolog C-like n=1 Tax=Haliotis rufescens TaxID=6454 RepID=UPI00201F04EB|nr:protein fem-1 homolog C-like [Haliotis rufescens]